MNLGAPSFAAVSRWVEMQVRHHLATAKKVRRKTCKQCAAFMRRWKPPRPPIPILSRWPRARSGAHGNRRASPIRFLHAHGLLQPDAALRSGKSAHNCASAFHAFSALCVCAALQRISGVPGRARGEHCLLGCDHQRDVPLRLQPRLHRSLLSVEDRHRALSQFALPAARAETARRHLLSDVRCAGYEAGQYPRQQRLPHGLHHAGNCGSRIHQGDATFLPSAASSTFIRWSICRTARFLPARCFRLGRRCWDFREEENQRAVAVAFANWSAMNPVCNSQAPARRSDQLEAEDRLGIVMLGRPYHHDPGINHEIMAQFQKLGYPVFSQSTLPMDRRIFWSGSLARRFAPE